MVDRQYRVTLRRTVAAFGGASLVLSVMYALYQSSVRMYYDYYFYAQVKDHYIAPPARYRLMDATFLVGMSLVLYVAYRLLRYSIVVAAKPASDR
jgi:hypothetical protein